MLLDKYGIHEKTVKKAYGSYRSLPMLRIPYYFIPRDPKSARMTNPADDFFGVLGSIFIVRCGNCFSEPFRKFQNFVYIPESRRLTLWWAMNGARWTDLYCRLQLNMWRPQNLKFSERRILTGVHTLLDNNKEKILSLACGNLDGINW